jgi:flagellar biosynthesis protein FlhF
MRLKTYFVDTVEEAMLRARSELGDEAMLVHSKRTGSEAEHLGKYEVVFASPQSMKPTAETVPAELSPPIAARKPPVRSERGANTSLKISTQDNQNARIRRELKALSTMMDVPPNVDRSRSEEVRVILDSLYGYLAEREVRSKHIEEITNGIGLRFMQGSLRRDGQTPEALLESALVEPLVGMNSATAASNHGIALIGPPGAGKTTTLAKIAVRQGLAIGRDVHVLDLDNQRIGGGVHLQTICDLLGISYRRVPGAEMLPDMLTGVPRGSLVLIDTPGLTFEDSTELAVLGLGLGHCAMVERHLVLPATFRNAEMWRYWAAYRICHPSHLLFSRVDESLCFGPIWSLAAETKLPVSWMSTGRKIPECLVEATARSIADLVHHGYSSPTGRDSTPFPAPRFNTGAGAYLPQQDTSRSLVSQ